MFTNNKRTIAVLHMRELGRIGNFIMKMSGIALMMGEKPLMYPSPTVPITTFALHIDELKVAEAEASRRTTGSAKARDTKYNQVLRDVHSLQIYVQNLADNAETEDEAKIIIENSGFDIKKYGVRLKPEFEVRQTKISGVVKLIAKRPGKYSANKWQMSEDAKTWIDLPETLTAKTIVKGLKISAKMYFRHCPILKGKLGNWSQTVSIIIT